MSECDDREIERLKAVVERQHDTIELNGRIIAAYAAEHDEINAINAALVGRELPILERARLVASRVNNAESQLAAVTKERDTANNALQGIGVMLGSSDEWSDQETMIYDVVARADMAHLPSEIGIHVASLTEERDDWQACAEEKIELLQREVDAHRKRIESCNVFEEMWRSAEKETLELESKLAERDAEIARLVEALTPSGATKHAYLGEFKFDIDGEDWDGNEQSISVTVPWTTTKEMMMAVLSRAEAREAEVERLKVALADETTRADDEYENGLCDGRDEQGETP